MTKVYNKNQIKALPNSQEIVGLGQVIFTRKPEDYNCLGLGTCLGIFLYDLKRKNYILAHTLLPKYSNFRRNNSKPTPGRFTDLAITHMIDKLMKEGSQKQDIKCKMVGGAKIFNDMLNIGQDNIDCAKEILTRENIKILGEDLGGRTSRSILNFQSDGTLHYRKQGKHYFL